MYKRGAEVDSTGAGRPIDECHLISFLSDDILRLLRISLQAAKGFYRGSGSNLSSYTTIALQTTASASF